MKLTTLSVFVALACTACSGEDIQLELEKAKPVASQTTQKSLDKDTRSQENLAQKQDRAAATPAKNKPMPAPSENALQNDTNAVANDNAGVSLEKETPIDPEMMRELEASLAKVNDAELLAVYGAKGSAIDLQLGGSDLTNGSVALEVSQQNLVSNVTSVSGATSITGDPTGFGFIIGLSGDYLFEFDKDTLTPKAQAALDSVLTLYKDYQGVNISVTGHTDSKGATNYNLDLSKRRASSVKQWFETAGIDSSLISTQGYGETKPVADNTKNGKDYPEGRALNRRVEIAVKTKKKVNHLPTVSKPTAF